MKAILHIGTEKTGSSAIQEYLFNNRTTLMKDGYYLFQSAGRKNCRELAFFCADDSHISDYLRENQVKSDAEISEFRQQLAERFSEELAAIPENIHTVIFTSEHFHSRTVTQAEVDRVKATLDPFFSDFKIICYLREQLDLCVSLYSTSVKSGSSAKFDYFLNRCHPQNYYYNYVELLQHWENTFGHTAMSIAVYEKSSLFNENLLDDFTVRLNPDLLHNLTPETLRHNASLSVEGQELMLAVNRSIPRLAPNGGINPMHTQLKKLITAELPGVGLQPPVETGNHIRDSFVSSNELLRKKYFPEKETVFATSSAPAKSPQKALNTALIETLSKVFDILTDEKKPA